MQDYNDPFEKFKKSKEKEEYETKKRAYFNLDYLENFFLPLYNALQKKVEEYVAIGLNFSCGDIYLENEDDEPMHGIYIHFDHGLDDYDDLSHWYAEATYEKGNKYITVRYGSRGGPYDELMKREQYWISYTDNFEVRWDNETTDTLIAEIFNWFYEEYESNKKFRRELGSDD